MNDQDMPFIRVKDASLPENRLVYQGPAEYGCVSVLAEDLVEVWACDPTHRHGAFELYLSVANARKLAKLLLQMAAEIECKAPQ